MPFENPELAIGSIEETGAVQVQDGSAGCLIVHTNAGWSGCSMIGRRVFQT